ncbi:thrombospondin type 3 repeat-containing protein [Agarivorans sp. QJM3NY_29]|uniref:thrombospondin type 3 repeat-containing protein n=1 Tax=unclassified Agarivorans TaxID=2636026 RepID=UPI003D7D6ECF
MKKLHPLALAVGMAISLSGCGGGEDKPPIGQLTLEATAIDGYLQNASVWLDINGDYIWNNREPIATSGEGGKAILIVSDYPDYAKYPIVVKAIAGQTIDQDAPEQTISFSYLMAAPAGQTKISPLSTLVHLAMQNDSELSVEQAKQAIASDLHIDPESILGDFISQQNSETARYAQLLVEAQLMPIDSQSAGAASQIVESYQQNKQLLASVTEEETIIINNGELAKVIDDDDDDNDGVLDKQDRYPNNANETSDSDNDGIGDNADKFPNNASETQDADNDGVGDNHDNCKNVANSQQTDSNDNGIGDACEPKPAATFDKAVFDQATWQ